MSEKKNTQHPSAGRNNDNNNERKKKRARERKRSKSNFHQPSINGTVPVPAQLATPPLARYTCTRAQKYLPALISRAASGKCHLRIARGHGRTITREIYLFTHTHIQTLTRREIGFFCVCMESNCELWSRVKGPGGGKSST